MHSVDDTETHKNVLLLRIVITECVVCDVCTAATEDCFYWNGKWNECTQYTERLVCVRIFVRVFQLML